MKKVMIRIKEFTDLITYIRVLKTKLKECERVNKFYEKQIKEYNKNFSGGG